MTEDVAPPSLAPEPFLRTFRALVEAYGAVMGVAEREIVRVGLNVTQYDVLVTLGDTPGMTCKELSDHTLITKGTLTGVLDRLEAKGLIERHKGARDARQIVVSLSAEGQALFERIFQPHVDHMGRYFAAMPEDRQAELTSLLQELKRAFTP